MTPSPRTTQKHSLVISSICRSIAQSSRPLPDGWPRESLFSTSVAVPARSVSISPSSDSSCSEWTCRNGCSSWRGDALVPVALFVAICARFPYLRDRFRASSRSTPSTTFHDGHLKLRWPRSTGSSNHRGRLSSPPTWEKQRCTTTSSWATRSTTVGGTLYREDELLVALDTQSFVVESVQRRGPLPHEHNSERIYLSCRRADT